MAVSRSGRNVLFFLRRDARDDLRFESQEAVATRDGLGEKPGTVGLSSIAIPKPELDKSDAFKSHRSPSNAQEGKAPLYRRKSPW